MKLWKKVLVLNIAGLLGVASSMFVVPDNTPVYLWLVLAGLTLAGFNVLIFVRRREIASGSRPATSKAQNVLIALGVAFWILDVLVHILRR